MPTTQDPMFINAGTILYPPMQGNNLVGAYGNTPTPEMPNNPGMTGMGFTQGMAQPFTQFVNGMPVQQTMPSTNISASDHPCQGKGGSGCGCGGSCKTPTLGGCCGQSSDKKGKISLNKITPQTKSNSDFSDPKAFLDQFGGFLNLPEFYRTRPGDTSFMTCDYQNGKIETIVSDVKEDGSIESSVRDAISGETIFTLSFPKVENGWQVNVDGKTLNSILPSSTPLELIGFMTWGAAIAEKANNRLIEENSFTPTPADVRPPDQPVCIPHDLVCSSFFGKNSNWPFTSDHKHVQWWAPCVGSFDVDISQCCLDHDIALWCHTGVLDIAAFNAAVVACIIGSVLAKAYELVAKSDCDWLWKILCMAAISLWILASGFLAGILYAIIATFAVSIQGLFGSNLVGQGAIFRSCLCGGDRSTVACDDTCRNLCHERGQDSTKCTWCQWKCVNLPGQPPQVVLDRGAHPNLPCCQGSDSSKDHTTGRLCGKSKDDAQKGC